MQLHESKARKRKQKFPRELECLNVLICKDLLDQKLG